MLSNDRGDPALTEMPVCRDFTPSLSPPSAPGAGGPRPLLPQDAHTLVALVLYITRLACKRAPRRRAEKAVAGKDLGVEPAAARAPAAHAAAQTGARGSSRCLAFILPCFLSVHSKIRIEHLPRVKSYRGAEEKTMNQIRHVTVLLALPLRVGCDGGGGGSSEDPSRACMCVWGGG